MCVLYIGATLYLYIVPMFSSEVLKSSAWCDLHKGATYDKSVKYGTLNEHRIKP